MSGTTRQGDLSEIGNIVADRQPRSIVELLRAAVAGSFRHFIPVSAIVTLSLAPWLVRESLQATGAMTGFLTAVLYSLEGIAAGLGLVTVALTIYRFEEGGGFSLRTTFALIWSHVWRLVRASFIYSGASAITAFLGVVAVLVLVVILRGFGFEISPREPAVSWPLLVIFLAFPLGAVAVAGALACIDAVVGQADEAFVPRRFAGRVAGATVWCLVITSVPVAATAVLRLFHPGVPFRACAQFVFEVLAWSVLDVFLTLLYLDFRVRLAGTDRRTLSVSLSSADLLSNTSHGILSDDSQ